jgi:hypothetical protein
MPSEALGKRFLSEARALTEFFERRRDSTVFTLELSSDAAGHAAMFKGRAPSQQNVVIAETVQVYSRD